MLIPYILAVENKRIINMRHANVSDILISFTFLGNGVERAKVIRQRVISDVQNKHSQRMIAWQMTSISNSVYLK